MFQIQIRPFTKLYEYTITQNYFLWSIAGRVYCDISAEAIENQRRYEHNDPIKRFLMTPIIIYAIKSFHFQSTSFGGYLSVDAIENMKDSSLNMYIFSNTMTYFSHFEHSCSFITIIFEDFQMWECGCPFALVVVDERKLPSLLYISNDKQDDIPVPSEAMPWIQTKHKYKDCKYAQSFQYRIEYIAYF